MPAPWADWTFAEQADFVVGQFEGLTEEDLEEIYDFWSKARDYLDHPYGRIQALTDLQIKAQEVYLKKHGKWEEYERLLDLDAEG
jgi:hypothetical protein